MCSADVFSSKSYLELKGDDVVIYQMMEAFAGLYTCVVSYQMNGRKLNFTRTINIKSIGKRLAISSYVFILFI